jgi:hypothetical protein
VCRKGIEKERKKERKPASQSADIRVAFLLFNGPFNGMMFAFYDVVT